MTEKPQDSSSHREQKSVKLQVCYVAGGGGKSGGKLVEARGMSEEDGYETLHLKEGVSVLIKADQLQTLRGRLSELEATSPAPQIEVTEEMLEAGALELMGWCSDFVTADEALMDALRATFGAENVTFPKSDK